MIIPVLLYSPRDPDVSAAFFSLIGLEIGDCNPATYSLTDFKNSVLV